MQAFWVTGGNPQQSFPQTVFRDNRTALGSGHGPEPIKLPVPAAPRGGPGRACSGRGAGPRISGSLVQFLRDALTLPGPVDGLEVGAGEVPQRHLEDVERRIESLRASDLPESLMASSDALRVTLRTADAALEVVDRRLGPSLGSDHYPLLVELAVTR